MFSAIITGISNSWISFKSFLAFKGMLCFCFSAILSLSLSGILEPLKAQPSPPMVNDPLHNLQWYFENTGSMGCSEPGIDLGVREAWALTRGDPSVIIAVIDTGIDLDHPDLNNQLYPRGEEDWNFSSGFRLDPADTTGHGTNVAGLACAEADNEHGIAGLAPDCRLMPLKVDGILSFPQNVLSALEYILGFVLANPDLRVVVNMSLSSSGGGFDNETAELITILRSEGVPTFCSAGNSGGDVIFPARHPDSFAIGAVAPNGVRIQATQNCVTEDFTSNRGPELDFVAPGVHLATTDALAPAGLTGGDYNGNFQGTSGASPLAAAVAALMLSANPELSVDDLEALLRHTARDGIGSPSEDLPGWDVSHGWGMIHAGAAVSAAQNALRFKRGDADLNGTIEITDALVILGFLFLGDSILSCLAAADIQDDNNVDISDAIGIFGYLFKGEAPPAEPFLTPGFDATPSEGLPLCLRTNQSI